MAQWAELTRVAWLYGLMLFGSIVLSVWARFDASPWPDTIVTGVTAVLIVGFVATHPLALSSLFGRPRASACEMLGWACGSLVLMAALHFYFAAMQALGVPFVGYTSTYRDAGWPVWSMFVMVSVMPAVFEEIAFRGVVQASLERVFSAREAWVIQGALFGVVHLLPLVFPSHVCIGLWLGWLRNRSGSLYPGMIVHGTWNAWVLADELWLS